MKECKEEFATAGIRIAEYDYPLPDVRIAAYPCEPRDACKLLVRKADGSISHHVFTDLPSLLPQGSLMVCNNTRVINARLKFRKETGALIEIFCLEPESPRDYAQMFQSRGCCRWSCMVGNLKRWKSGSLTLPVITSKGGSGVLTATRIADGEANSHIVEFAWTPNDVEFGDIIEAAGRIPIPPYLNRNSEDSDSQDYQTVYSRIEGSVAAPTAGLHFTQRVLDDLRRYNVERRELTLHVGAGTFRPVKSETIGNHNMHSEVFEISRDLLETIIQAKESGRPVTAVGTTTVRTLESLPWLGVLCAENEGGELHLDQWKAYNSEIGTVEMLRQLAEYMDSRGLQMLTASTAIMIAPGFRWRVVDHIVTNFHQPQSTLLLLVSSFLRQHGTAESWREMYDFALENDYRFLSYGDSCLLL